MKQYLSLVIIFLGTASLAQDFPSEGSVFIYETSDFEGEVLVETYVSTITILDVTQDVVSFSFCAKRECKLGQTDGIFATYLDFYPEGQSPDLGQISDGVAFVLDNPWYDAGQFLPYVDGREVSWKQQAGVGSQVTTFTQTCCVEDHPAQDIWQMNFKVKHSTGWTVRAIAQHYDPSLGWYLFEQIDEGRISGPDIRQVSTLIDTVLR